ncbi:hypothetical protein JHK84_031545 [Glycine max]|nr:hypothetical protein JHK84_031545 [Glycine max]
MAAVHRDFDRRLSYHQVTNFLDLPTPEQVSTPIHDLTTLQMSPEVVACLQDTSVMEGWLLCPINNESSLSQVDHQQLQNLMWLHEGLALPHTPLFSSP